jgi:hypothetical protein
MNLEREFVATSEAHLVSMATEVMSNTTHLHVLEQKVCSANHVLYSSQSAVDEWARFLLDVALT